MLCRVESEDYYGGQEIVILERVIVMGVVYAEEMDCKEFTRVCGKIGWISFQLVKMCTVLSFRHFFRFLPVFRCKTAKGVDPTFISTNMSRYPTIFSFCNLVHAEPGLILQT